MKTYNDIYIDARRRLRAAGVSMFDLEARLIMSHVSGQTQAEFLRDSRRFVTDPGFIAGVDDMLARRETGEPIAYLVGEWEFYGLPLVVSRAVLIPRADTETLADAVIAALKRSGGRGRALDLCAGSGCIGLAVAANVPNCRVVLADLSPGAMRLCRANILRNGLTRNVTAAPADACASPPPMLGKFDVIACNPPYIPTGDIETLDHSVRDFEPREALDGGEDGLTFFRAVSDKWKGALSPGGTLLFECGAGQADEVGAIMQAYGYSDISVISDTQGIGRVVSGKV